MSSLNISKRSFRGRLAIVVLAGLIIGSVFFVWEFIYPEKEVLQDPVKYIHARMSECYYGGGHACYRDVADDFLKKFSGATILQTFRDNEWEPEIFARCHEVTHHVGRALLLEGRSVAELFGQCTSVCHGGCYHGVLEGYMGERQRGSFQSPEEIFTAEAPMLCGKAEDYKVPHLYGECLHGLGHAAMFVTDNDVFRSLKLCDVLVERDRSTCYSGVFMENSSSSTADATHRSKFLRSDDPLYPCSALSQQYLETCYRYQSSYFAILTSHDWKKIGELCLSVPNIYQTACFETVGTNQVGFTQDINRMYADCMLMPNNDAQRSCVRGVVISFGGRYLGEPSRMVEFCAIIDSAMKEVCYEQMGYLIMSWTNDSAQQLRYCGFIQEPDMLALCISVR